MAICRWGIGDLRDRGYLVQFEGDLRYILQHWGRTARPCCTSDRDCGVRFEVPKYGTCCILVAVGDKAFVACGDERQWCFRSSSLI